MPSHDRRCQANDQNLRNGLATLLSPRLPPPARALHSTHRLQKAQGAHVVPLGAQDLPEDAGAKVQLAVRILGRLRGGRAGARSRCRRRRRRRLRLHGGAAIETRLAVRPLPTALSSPRSLARSVPPGSSSESGALLHPGGPRRRRRLRGLPQPGAYDELRAPAGRRAPLCRHMARSGAERSKQDDWRGPKERQQRAEPGKGKGSPDGAERASATGRGLLSAAAAGAGPRTLSAGGTTTRRARTKDGRSLCPEPPRPEPPSLEERCRQAAPGRAATPPRQNENLMASERDFDFSQGCSYVVRGCLSAAVAPLPKSQTGPCSRLFFIPYTELHPRFSRTGACAAMNLL